MQIIEEGHEQAFISPLLATMATNHPPIVQENRVQGREVKTALGQDHRTPALTFPKVLQQLQSI